MRNSPTSAIELFARRLRERSLLSDEELNALRALPGRLATVQARVDIVCPGETTDHACLVVEGLAGRFGQVIDGRRQITALHIPGDMCDLHSVVTPKVSWALQTLCPTTIMRISHRVLRDLARTYPALAEAFWRDCCVDASVLSQWVVNVGRRDARSRVAHLFCEMGVRMERAGLGCRTAFRLDASQAQIADATGLTSVHANRVYQALRASGAIDIRGREVHIADWKALAEIADFDPGYLHLEPAHSEGATGQRHLQVAQD